MKKTLAAVAVLGAFAGSALAADVTVYGRVDTGLGYDKTQVEVNGIEKADEDGWGLNSGMLTTSRIGIKGSEQINDGLTVGFALEKSIKPDVGSTGEGFDRESSMFVKSDFGTLYAGKLGTVWSDAGSAGKYAAIANVDGTGHSGLGQPAVGILQISDTRYDNTLAYVSPKFAGFEVFAQYSMGDNDNENKASADRYAAIGFDYQADAFKAAMVVETLNEKTEGNEVDDMIAVHLGGTYDFGVAKASLAAVYFDNANDFGGLVSTFNDEGGFEEGKKGFVSADDLSGYGVSLGVAVPVAGGTFTTTAGYVEGDGTSTQVGYGVDNAEGKVYNIGVNYQYPLSKQVKVYAGAGYTKSEIEADSGLKAEMEEVKVGAGMAIYF